MPQQQALPTWVALNNMNSVSQSGNADPITGFQYAGGGLNLGDYFDLTTDEAAAASYTTNGTCFAGRYRYVYVDSGATASNVKTGTVGYMRSGTFVASAITTNVGSGLTNGTYQVAATAGTGGGSGAQAVDGPVRPVVFLNSITPGNYGFIQELGTATVLNAASTLQTQGQFAIVQNLSATGVMAASATTLTIYTIGQVIDPVVNTAPANVPFKIQLGYGAGVVQD